jgi:hypothetical protein
MWDGGWLMSVRRTPMGMSDLKCVGFANTVFALSPSVILRSINNRRLLFATKDLLLVC